MAASGPGSSATIALEESVGDANQKVLDNVKRIAKALLLHQASSVENDSEDSKPLDDWVSEKIKLHLELVELMAELQLRQSLIDRPLDTDDSEYSDETLKLQLEDLEKELLSAKLQNLQDVRVLECLHHQKHVMEQLFTRDHGKVDVSQTSVGKVVHEQTELVSELLYKRKELDKLKKEQWTVRQDRVAVQQECREWMARLDELKQQEDDPFGDVSDEEDSPLNRLQQSLKRSRDEVTLLRHTLLGLVAGSGVNWSKDQELAKLVLKLGLLSN